MARTCERRAQVCRERRAGWVQDRNLRDLVGRPSGDAKFQLIDNDVDVPSVVVYIPWTCPSFSFGRSDWDFNVCLSNECKRKQIRHHPFSAGIDARAVYQKFYSRRPQGLEGALKDLGIEFEGRQHSGLCDAKNTGKLVARMVSDGCLMVITGRGRAALPARLRNSMPTDVEPAVGGKY